MEIILGSSSTFRQKLLTDAGIPFTVMESNIDEKAFGGRLRDPRRLTVTLAHAKAEAILARKHVDGLLITSFQVVVSDNKIIEKPSSVMEAKSWLLGYHLSPPTTYTAVVVTNTKTRKQMVDVDIATVIFRQINLKSIERAIKRGTIMERSGAFDLDDTDLIPFIEVINGDRTGVIGLPMTMVTGFLKAMGYEGR